eukprot:1582578-Karenia_brevis.AAC.1
MVAEPPAIGSGPPVVDDENEKIMKIVAKTVEVVMEKLIPQLQTPQYESSRRETVDDKKKIALEEKYFRRIEKYAGDST